MKTVFIAEADLTFNGFIFDILDSHWGNKYVLSLFDCDDLKGNGFSNSRQLFYLERKFTIGKVYILNWLTGRTYNPHQFDYSYIYGIERWLFYIEIIITNCVK